MHNQGYSCGNNIILLLKHLWLVGILTYHLDRISSNQNIVYTLGQLNAVFYCTKNVFIK